MLNAASKAILLKKERARWKSNYHSITQGWNINEINL
jgi:hypothetical protein